MLGSIAQLVQSVCLTSRGSGVRLPLLPLKKRSDFPVAFFVMMKVETPGPLLGGIGLSDWTIPYIRSEYPVNEIPHQEAEEFADKEQDGGADRGSAVEAQGNGDYVADEGNPADQG